MSEILKGLVHALINGNRAEAEGLLKQTLESKTRQIAGILETNSNLLEDDNDLAPIDIWTKYQNYPEELKKREKIFARDSEISCWYALYNLKGPFKLGESAIAKSAQFSYEYALHVLKGPFKLGEPAIAKNAEWSYQYALHVLNGRFELGEPAIAKDKDTSYYYNVSILKKPGHVSKDENHKEPWPAGLGTKTMLKAASKPFVIVNQSRAESRRHDGVNTLNGGVIKSFSSLKSLVDFFINEEEKEDSRFCLWAEGSAAGTFSARDIKILGMTPQTVTGGYKASKDTIAAYRKLTPQQFVDLDIFKIVHRNCDPDPLNYDYQVVVFNGEKQKGFYSIGYVLDELCEIDD